jgi:hypothetical protein
MTEKLRHFKAEEVFWNEIGHCTIYSQVLRKTPLLEKAAVSQS